MSPVMCSECRSAADRREAIRDAHRKARFELHERWRRGTEFGHVAGRVIPPSAEAIAESFVTKRIENAAICGPTGKGKTTLGVCALLRWVALYGGTAMFIGPAELALMGLKLTEEPLRADFVLLDDVGDESPGSPRDRLREIIQGRHDRAKATWVTSGFDGKTLSSLLGGGKGRRMFEDAPTIILGGAP